MRDPHLDIEVAESPGMGNFPENNEPHHRFALDEPASETTLIGDVVRVRGWALLTGFPPSRVEVSVAGSPPKRARLRLFRPDVAAAFPDHQEAGFSGFEVKVALDIEPASSTRISVQVRVFYSHQHPGQQRQWILPIRHCTIKKPAPTNNDNQVGQGLRDRASTLLARTEQIRDPRHILVFAHSLRLGGGALWLQELLSGLVKAHGWRATVITQLDGPLRGDLERLDIPIHLTQPCDPSTVAAYEGQVTELALLAKASSAGVALVNTLGAFVGTDAMMRAELPTAWALHESFPVAIAADEEWGSDRINPAVRNRWESLLNQADELLFVADSTKEMFQQHCPHQIGRTVRYGTPMVHYAGNTQPRTRTEARTKLGIPLDATLILNIGIMEPRKGQSGLLAAAKRVREHHEKLTLAIVGYESSPYGVANAKLVSQLGLESWVKLIDAHPHPLLWLQSADFFINCSDIESLPRSILEAICCGIPVLASDIFGAREIITDSQTGWLFEPNDIDALTVAMLRALDTPQAQRISIAKAAFEQLADQLNPAAYCQEYSNILTNLARGK